MNSIRNFGRLLAASLLAMCAVTASFAQTNATSDSTSRSTAAASTAPISNGASTGAVSLQLTQQASPIPANTTALVEQRGRVDTTASVFLPGNAVASGQFNCGATGSAGIGGTGFSFGLSGAKSLSACVYMNLMAFSSAARDPELYVSALCSMDEGKTVMKEVGRECPSETRERKARESQAAGQAPVAGNYQRPRVGTIDSMGHIVQ